MKTEQGMLLFAAAFMLSGCDSLNIALGRVFESDAAKARDQESRWCTTSPARSMGRSSALNDESREGALLRYQQICQKYGISVNAADWQAGYDEGDKHYCDYNTAYNTGLSNEPYNFSRCDSKSPKHRKNLKEAFAMGRDYYSLQWAADSESEAMTRDAEQLRELQTRRERAEYGTEKMTYSDKLKNSDYQAAYRRSYAEAEGRRMRYISQQEMAGKQHQARLAQMEKEK